MTFQFVEEAGGEVAGGGVEGFTHLDNTVALLVFHLHIIQETGGHSLQGVFWPRLEKEKRTGSVKTKCSLRALDG